MNEFSSYHENGYKDRADYLEGLADEYDCPIETVRSVADVLGENEDFNGLVSLLQDWEETTNKER